METVAPRIPISPDNDHNHAAAEGDDDTADHACKSGGYHVPRELICDAFGTCRHKIAIAQGRAKEEAVEDAWEVKEAVSQKLHEASDRVRREVESAKDTARSVKEGLSELAESAGESVRENKRDAKTEAESIGTRAKRIKDFSQRHLGLDALSRLLNLAGFATAYGMCVWVSFISSYVLASMLPRHQFGPVRNKIYPVFYWAMVNSITATLLGHLLSRRKLLVTSQPEALPAYILSAAIWMVLVNMLCLEPLATKVMVEKMKLEKEEGRGSDLGAGREDGTSPLTTSAAAGGNEDQDAGATRRLNERQRKLNRYSSLLNLTSLMALSWHLVHLSQRLSITCH